MWAESPYCRYRYAAGTDVGVSRSSNQDKVICCPEHGFFAVSDGMGGLSGGGDTSDMVAKVLPLMVAEAALKIKENPAPDKAAALLSDIASRISDNVYNTLNRDIKTSFGATLCGVWLLRDNAVFLNLGDSRGYRLGFYKKQIRQITSDHNIAAMLVESGELSKNEARRHPSSSSLTRFVGMKSPARPETYITELHRGDTILLCSDGLHGMVEDERLPGLLRSSRSPERVVERLMQEANLAGGRDNTAVVYIKAFCK